MSEKSGAIPEQLNVPSSDKVIEEIYVYDSKTLFRKKHEIKILHNNQIYRLKITRQNKLILHK